MILASPPAAAVQPAAPARPTLGTIVLLGGLTAFGAVSIDLYLPGLPTIGRDLHASAAAVQQTMSAFFIGMALGQLVYGPLSDRVGRRPALLVGAGIYVAASLGCAAAPTVGWLIAGRFVQALGACAGQVVTRAVVRDRYAHEDSARIFSLLTLVLGVAPMLAPTVGGWLVTVASWRDVFYILAAFGVVLGVAVALRLDESRSAATAAQAQAESTAQSFAALIRRRRLVAYLLAGALNGAALFTWVAGAPDLLITQFGFTPAQFGLCFSVMAVGVIGASQVNRWLLDRAAADRILAVASLAGVAAGLLLVLAVVLGAGRWGILAALFACLTSYGFMAANSTAGALAVDPSRAGATSALIGAAAFAVGAVAATLAGGLHDGTALPLAAVVAVSLGGAAAALHGLALPRA